MQSIILALFLVFGSLLPPLLGGCSSATVARRDHEEGEEHGPRPPRPPPEWFGGMKLDALDVPGDTISFHIGAPLFLRLRVEDRIACEPFNGRPFYFDATGAQVGWGFEEVADSVLLQHLPSVCDRFLLLSSENSNRIPEGYYSLKVLIFVDEHRQLYSDTVVLHAVRSVTGADTLSYTRFLQEQILTNSPLLGDPETLRALFGQGTPRSAESEIYRSLIHWRGGDTPGARDALANSRRLEQSGKSRPPGTTAALLRDHLAALPGLSY